MSGVCIEPTFQIPSQSSSSGSDVSMGSPESCIYTLMGAGGQGWFPTCACPSLAIGVFLGH
jgi:hypothetical protein